MSTWQTMSVADTLQANSSFRSSFSLAFDKTPLYVGKSIFLKLLRGFVYISLPIVIHDL